MRVVGNVITGAKTCCAWIYLVANYKVYFNEEPQKPGGGTDSYQNIPVKPTPEEAVVAPPTF